MVPHSARCRSCWESDDSFRASGMGCVPLLGHPKSVWWMWLTFAHTLTLADVGIPYLPSCEPAGPGWFSAFLSVPRLAPCWVHGEDSVHTDAKLNSNLSNSTHSPRLRPRLAAICCKTVSRCSSGRWLFQEQGPRQSHTQEVTQTEGLSHMVPFLCPFLLKANASG